MEKFQQWISRQKISAKDVFRSLYWNGIDSYRILARIPAATERVRYENEDLIREALLQGPVVAISVHQGAFENLHRSLCRYSDRVLLITSPFKSNSLTQALQEIRRDDHLREYSTEELSSVVRSLFKSGKECASKSNGILAMLVDQARDARGNPVELLGRQGCLYLRLPQKMNQMGASIVTFRTWSENILDSKQKKLRQHVVRFERVYPPHYESLNSVTLPQAIAKEIEQWIVEHPEQWTWNYHGNFSSSP